jgi:hypothetical protein
MGLWWPIPSCNWSRGEPIGRNEPGRIHHQRGRPVLSGLKTSLNARVPNAESALKIPLAESRHKGQPNLLPSFFFFKKIIFKIHKRKFIKKTNLKLSHSH